MSETKSKKTKKTSKKRGKKLWLVVLLLIVVALFIAGYISRSQNKAGLESETVMIGTAEDKISVSGYIVREEYVAKAPEAGVLSFRTNDGERVAKGYPVAVIYSGDVSDEVKSELSSIHQHIMDAKGSSVEKNLYAGDVTGGSSQVENNIEMISKAVYKGDLTKVTSYKDDIIRIIRNDTAAGVEAQTTMEKLQARKTELENSISGRATSVYSAFSGVMCSQLDGCEEYFNKANLEKITPDYLDNAPDHNLSSPDSVVKDENCFKIINNYEWYYTASVSEKWLGDLKVGDSVSLRFTDVSSEKMSAEVTRISEASGGKVALVIKCHSIFPGMYTARDVKAEIVRKTYKGFKVSKEAIHIEDGKYFVYINSEGAVRRRDVDVLYSDDAYVIIKEDNSAKNNLLLYDEVLISDSILKEGEIL